MHRALTISALALVILAACGGAAQIEPTAIPPDGFDLTDAGLQAQLGSPELENIVWQRTAGALTVVGSGTTPQPNEVELIAAVADDVPDVLWDQVDVRTVVRAANAPGDRLPHGQPVAYALGPDIYLLDRSFEISDSGSTRYDLARAFIHELVHVAQFTTLSDEYVAAALGGEIESVDPTAGSELVWDFAQSTGWRRQGGSLDGDWALPDDVAASSLYGRTNPGEDMAEAVTLVSIGLPDLVPADRVDWVEDWLGTSASELAKGRPWAPPGSEEVLSADPLYDEPSVAAIAVSDEHVEPLYFQLPLEVPPADALAETISTELFGRGMTGTLLPLDDPRLPRYGGTFLGRNGVTWWVELWDFRERPDGSTGPDAPLLTYVAVW